MIYYIIYKTTNIVNGKFYVGKHKCTTLEFDGYYGSGKLLKKAIEKYGEDSFIRETISLHTTQEAADIAESIIVSADFLIENRGICYNLAVGGKGGFQVVNEAGELVNVATLQAVRDKISASGKIAQNRPEVRERKSASQMGEKNHRYGDQCSDEHKKQISDAHTGRVKSDAERLAISNGLSGHVVSEETRKKISEANIGNTASVATKLAMSAAKMGKSHSEDTKQKISESHTGMVYEARTCPYCLLNGRGPNMTRYHFDNCKMKSAA